MILIRAMEAGGVGIAVAAGFSLLLAVALLVMGRSATAFCAGALATGAIVGVAFATIHRPSVLAAAAEADRQLDLADLLATALTRRNVDDPWQAAVLAVAADRCRSLSPSSVLLARFGVRAWGGVGLAAALVLAVGALSISSTETVARAGDPTAAIVSQRNGPTDPTMARIPAGRVPSAAPRPASHAIAPQPTDDASPAGSNARIASARPGNALGSGIASAQTSSSAAQSGAIQLGAKGDAPLGDKVGGGARAGSHPPASAGTDRSSGVSSAEAELPLVMPWQSSDWSMARNAAERALHERRVPETYADVLRLYFSGN